MIVYPSSMPLWLSSAVACSCLLIRFYCFSATTTYTQTIMCSKFRVQTYLWFRHELCITTFKAGMDLKLKFQGPPELQHSVF